MIQINAKKILWTLLAINVVLFGLYLAAHYTPLKNSTTAFEFVDVDTEANPPAWYGGILWLLMAIPAAVRGLQLRQEDRKSNWKIYLFAALVAVFLSMDEIGTVHERINRYFGGSMRDIVIPTNNRSISGALTIGLYGVIGIIVLLFLARDLLAFLKEKRGLTPILAGAAIFFIGAALVDNLMPYAIEPLEHGLEELCEMTGTALMLYGFLVKLDRVTIEVTSAGSRQ